MNIKLKRAVRTPHSEEIDIFDANIRDEHDQAINIGKLEVHYLDDQVVGTLLIWQEFAEGLNRSQGSHVILDDVIDAILTEVTEPVGVSSEYGIEIYFPSVINHQFASHYVEDEEAAEGEQGEGDEEYEEYEEYEDDENESEDEEEQDDTDGENQSPDDYYRNLTQRP
jgi:hypothetical protein